MYKRDSLAIQTNGARHGTSGDTRRRKYASPCEGLNDEGPEKETSNRTNEK